MCLARPIHRFFKSSHGDLVGMCHGDDFARAASLPNQSAFLSCLEKSFECRVIGTVGFVDGQGGQKSVEILNRIVSAVVGGADGPYLALEPDPKHAESLFKQFGLEKGKTASTPRIRKTAEQAEADSRTAVLNAQASTAFRSATMRLAYVGQDRPDLAEAIKHLTTRMSQPRESDLAELKRLVRYVRYRPRAELRFPLQQVGTDAVFLDLFVDSDWAGDLTTRRSTTGLIAMLGGHCVKHASLLQSQVGLSSGEAEFYALCRGAATGLGLVSYLADLGVNAMLRCHNDSSAARAVASRRGLGKLRHVHTRFLWLQSQVASKAVQLRCVRGPQNPADALTKPLTESELLRHCTKMGLSFDVSAIRSDGK